MNSVSNTDLTLAHDAWIFINGLLATTQAVVFFCWWRIIERGRTRMWKIGPHLVEIVKTGRELES